MNRTNYLALGAVTLGVALGAFYLGASSSDLDTAQAVTGPHAAPSISQTDVTALPIPSEENASIDVLKRQLRGMEKEYAAMQTTLVQIQNELRSVQADRSAERRDPTDTIPPSEVVDEPIDPVASYESEISTQRFDPDFSHNVDQWIAQTLSQGTRDADLEDIACYQTLCRIDLFSSAEGELEQFLTEAAADPNSPFVNEFSVHSERDGDGISTRIYLNRG